MEGFMLLIFCSLMVSTVTVAIATDSITLGQSIRDGETIVSAGEGFELGFFSPGKSKSRYVGIWYKKVSTRTVTWVANRDAPISDHSGVLSITQQGTLVLLNSSNYTVWSTNVSRTAKNPIAVLLETGNLVVKDGNDDNNPDRFLWQSFDHLCDTLLPGMKLGANLVSGLNRFLSSWKSLDDPAEGEFKHMIDPRGVPQLVLYKGSVIQLRAGSWNGLRWTGVPQLKPNPVYTFEFVWNANEAFYRFNIENSSVLSRMVLDPAGVVHRLIWVERTNRWESFSRFSGVTLDQCEKYAFCGAYASCGFKMNSPVCECLEGFIPKFPDEWNFSDWSDGCVRRTKLGCEKGDGFLKHKSVKLPDTRHAWVDKNISLSECEKLCLKNCSCTAYATADIRERGSGCLLWFDGLIDIRELSEIGQDLYIRLASSEIANIERKRQSRKKILVAIIVLSILLATGLLMLGCFLYRRKRKLSNQEAPQSVQIECNNQFYPFQAWRLWIEGRPVELINKSLDNSCALSELLRCIHVGLLCVQQAPEDRPSMSTVVLMLSGERSLPQPKQPGFFTESKPPLSESSSSISKEIPSSTNEITFSLLEPR
ncbi:hypothetical protein Pint_04371 [Pistacia integerrima]|uniref:Uncharacterized protein n=1 Tax=Pistacia integerrima TaxID=434235 RepID=A0ACC0Z5K9_9ROSI|nr:hypothetical protein Pint_04371 [Pistacia integerrima]